MAINWIFITIGLFYIVPFLALLRYYSIIKNLEYLLAAMIYLLLFLNGLIIGILGFANIFETMTVLGAILLIIVVCRRVLPPSKNPLFNIIFSMCILLTIGNFLLIGTEDQILEIYRILMFETIRLLLGFYLVYVYSKVNLILENQRTTIVANIWKFGGLIAFLTALIRIIDMSVYLGSTPSNQLNAFDPALNGSLTLISVGALTLSVLTGITAIVYPELFLLTKHQVKNIYQLYDIADQLQNKKDFQILPSHVLLDYISSIEKEFDQDTLLDSTES